jgi:hypothetical protein
VQPNGGDDPGDLNSRNTISIMADDPFAELRRRHRVAYLREHEAQRRVTLKAEGAAAST